MGKIKIPLNVKLFSSIIFNNETTLFNAKNILTGEFGEIDFESDILSFTHTIYYNKEMGDNLKRQFFSFKNLIQPDYITDVKIFTNKVESNFLKNANRSVNIDPGYITLGKMVLATTKDYSHRVYIKDGIYAEATLRFFKGSYSPFSYTYPDYSSKEVIDIFNYIRNNFKQEIS